MGTSASLSGEAAPRHSKYVTSLRRRRPYFCPACSRSASRLASRHSKASGVITHSCLVETWDSKSGLSIRRRITSVVSGKKGMKRERAARPGADSPRFHVKRKVADGRRAKKTERHEQGRLFRHHLHSPCRVNAAQK